MNKKYIYATVTIIALILTTACSDFLNVTPRDKKVVKTIEDHRDILASYMYLLKKANRPQIKVMGVDAYAFPKFDMSETLSFYTGESLINTRLSYYFNQETQEYNQRGINTLTWLIAEPYVWNQYYRFLGPINMLIKDIANAEGNDENMRNYVQGEAIIWRIYSYFKLLQYYSPYKNDHYGIPMYLDPSDNIGTAMPKRLTQTQVFDLILKDCNYVLELLKKTPTRDWNFAYREDFVYAMMASIYQWKAMSGAATSEDWKFAKQYAEKAIGVRQLASTEEELRSLFDCRPEILESANDNAEYYIRISDTSNEAGVLRLSSSYYRQQGSSTTGIAPENFIRIYESGDRRKNFYFIEDKETIKNDKYNLSNVPPYLKVGTLMPYRLADMYLIKAEAACRLGDIATATQTLNTFKHSRYDTFETLSGNAEQILKEILMERKREFYLENDMLWLEMKRIGEKVEREVNGKKYILEPNDFRYSFPIPMEEMKRNKNMEQNPGWENIFQDH